MTEQEQWRNIEGHPGYQVSNMGNVISFKKKGVPKMLKQYVDRYGYCWVSLCHLGRKKYNARVTTLVADAWIGPLPTGLHRAHDNGNSQDNRSSNIVYKTCTENNRDRIRHGTMPRGESSGTSTLKEWQVKEIFQSSEPDTVLSARYQVARYAIWAIRRRKSWIHITKDLPNPPPTRRAAYGELNGQVYS